MISMRKSEVSEMSFLYVTEDTMNVLLIFGGFFIFNNTVILSSNKVYC